LLIVLSDEHTQGESWVTAAFYTRKAATMQLPLMRYSEPRRIPRNPSLLQGFPDSLDSSRMLARLFSGWLPKNPFPPRLLKRAQMQGGKRWVE
jgi:hypothetical protein